MERATFFVFSFDTWKKILLLCEKLVTYINKLKDNLTYMNEASNKRTGYEYVHKI